MTHPNPLRRSVLALALLVGGWLTAGSALAYEMPQAVQNRAAWARHDATLRDCEEAYRSFRARTTQAPSERRAARERCRRQVAQAAESTPVGAAASPTTSDDREVALVE